MILEAKKQHYQIGLLQQVIHKYAYKRKLESRVGKFTSLPVGGVTCWENTELPLL